METDKTYIQQEEEVEEEEEDYVLIVLDGACDLVDIPPNAPYTLSGLDMLNPSLTIGDNLKLIGEYEETDGTCIIFSENESTTSLHREMDPAISYQNQAYPKEVKPRASLQKILKFRLISESDAQDSGQRPANPCS